MLVNYKMNLPEELCCLCPKTNRLYEHIPRPPPCPWVKYSILKSCRIGAVDDSVVVQ